MARRYQVKIYNKDQTLNLAILSDNIILTGQNTSQLNGEDTLLFAVNVEHAQFSFIQKGRIARLVDTVDAIERSYRIISVIYKREGEKYTADIKCEGLQYDLSYLRHPLSASLIDQSPTTHMTQILSATSWTVGTVTPTAVLTLEYDYNAVMYDLLALRQRASEVSGTEYDLEFTTTPGGAKTVSLKLVGAITPTASIDYAKNLLGLTYEDSIPEANIVYGRGGEGSKGIPMTIGTATHRITAINSSTITLDSRKVVSSDGTWDSFYSIENPDGSLTDITSSIKPGSGNDQLTLASVAGLSVDDAVRIVGTNGGDVDIVWDKASYDLYGPRVGHFQDENFSDVFNRLGPARFSTLSGTYTAGLCEGWELVGTPTVTENTDTQYIINGTKSQKVVVGSFASVPAFVSVEATGDDAYVLGTFTYKSSYITDGGEGDLSSASGSVASTNQGILVTFSGASVPAQATHRRLYRIKNGGATYYKVADIPISQLLFLDTTRDADLTVEPSGVNTAGGGDGVRRAIISEVDEQYAAVIYLYVTTGRVRCYLSSGDEIYPAPNLPDDERATTSVATATKFVVTLSGFQAKDTTTYLNIVGHDGNDTFYVDSAMLVKSPYPPNTDTFVADNAATDLWHKTYDYLQTAKDTQLLSRLAITYANLYEAGIGADQISLGDRVDVTDSKLGISLTGGNAPRVVRKTVDIVEPWNSELEINSAIPRISDDYYNRRRREQQTSRSLSRNITRTAEEFRAQQETSRNPMIIIKELAD